MPVLTEVDIIAGIRELVPGTGAHLTWSTSGVDGRDGGGEVQGCADAERLVVLMPGRRAEMARGRLLAGIG